jgi:hypothetical protein
VSSFVQHKNLHNDVNFSNVDDSAEVAWGKAEKVDFKEQATPSIWKEGATCRSHDLLLDSTKQE